MVKRTLFFSNPAYLSTKNEQLVVSFPEDIKLPVTIPIEDLGYIVLEHPQITLTNGLMGKLIENKTAVITCDKQHLPNAILQPLTGHSVQTERYRHQLNASVPLKKNLWQQTVSVKIANQAHHLSAIGKDSKKLKRWANEVKSGDVENHEAIAAAFYFQSLFSHVPDFSRNQKGMAPNGLLNYGYAILRAVTARALISSGLLPSVGVFHSNKYNAFCLADDIMEPYRIYVDALVYDITQKHHNYEDLTHELKTILLAIPAMDVVLEGKRSPLMVAMSRTTNSLYECYAGISRKILYPVFEVTV
ncbi:type II CRISPR-associated endonuclease Cas1 [Flavobacterium salilacus subsp. salilacus]|uniref:type II CRISPR-associated endonuclease Cas1 n=1 Tax=Flavobacterium TaxID=237 RepID=UPI00107556F4|nr:MULTISPECIES: type II CRISPR-associated endonuclease Cas1 [Flavobacterium]KAF2518535.1 type II CRISPR-associated endonuclease Cas1 [Flavobacterium salilacus subsp. salilacus]MBE1615178.1 type II CRISPR-associated endonuclease Cas1 [Flavobacterium sp. SaA2.13]